MKQSKRKLSGLSNFAKKKALTQISSSYYFSSTPSNLKDSSKGRGGGGALICFFFFALFMETRYFEETDNSYHDFFQHSYKQNLGSLRRPLCH